MKKTVILIAFLLISNIAYGEITGYNSENGRVTLLENGKPVQSIEMPNQKDKDYVKNISKEIKDKIIKYINKPDSKISIIAARPVAGRILLVDCANLYEDNGNIHIVFDLKANEVIGFFTWYP